MAEDHMYWFHFTAKDANGKQVYEQIPGNSWKQVRERLEEVGYTDIVQEEMYKWDRNPFTTKEV